jgi:hypothetical protein
VVLKAEWLRTGDCFGDIAQLVEHLLCKQGVTGSNPVVSIIAGSPSANALAKRVRGDNPPEGRFLVHVDL